MIKAISAVTNMCYQERMWNYKHHILPSALVADNMRENKWQTLIINACSRKIIACV